MRWWPVAMALVGCASTVDGTTRGTPDASPPCEAATPWPCPTGWVALRDGGCGPAFRACPAGAATAAACAGVDLTAPSSASQPWVGVREGVDTPAGDWHPAAGIARCPDGWLRRDDGTCDPNLSAACPEGTGPLPGGACTATGEADCPPGPWPVSAEAPRGRLIHALAEAPAAGADGSMARPYATLAEAVAAARSGDRVVLGNGAYAMPRGPWPEGVGLAGRCAARVTVSATVGEATEVSGEVAWSGVTLRGARPSVRAGGAFSLTRAVLADTRDRAVEAVGASVRMEDVWAHDHRGDPSGANAVVVLIAGATGRAERVAMTRSETGCFRVDGAGTGAALNTGLTVTRGAFVQVGGACFDALESRLSLTDVAIRTVRGTAILDRYRGAMALDGVSVDGLTLESIAGNKAVEALVAASITGRRLSIRNVAAAFEVGLVGPMDLDEVTVDGVGTLLDIFGRASAGERPPASIRRARVRARATIWVGAGVRVTLRENDFLSAGAPRDSVSFVAHNGARLAIEASRIEHGAILPIGEDVELTIDRSLFVGDPQAAAASVPWVYAYGSQRVRITHTLAAGRNASAFVARAGARIEVEDSIVRDFEAPPAYRHTAVIASNGSSIRLTRTQLSSVGPHALGVTDPGSTLTLTDVDVAAPSDPAGVPLTVANGGRAEIRRLSLDGARGAATLVDGSSSALVANDLHVARVAPSLVTADAPRALAACIAVQRGGDARLTQATLSGAPLGLVVSDARLTLTSAHMSDVTAFGALRSEGDRAGLSLTNVGVCREALPVDPALPRLTPPDLAER